MAGWTYIILCTISSVLIAHFFKIAESRNLNTIRVLTINYLIAFPFAFLIYKGPERTHILSNELIVPVLLGVITGVIFICNFFIYSKSVDRNGVGISIAAMRISLIVPVLISTVWYMELLTWEQWAGLLLVFVVLYLLLPEKNSLHNKASQAGWMLPALFILTGLGDASLKIYEREFAEVLSKGEFMGMIFFTAFLIGLSIILSKKEWKFTREEILIGVCIGIPNLLAAIFLIGALEHMNGAVVFSSVNVLTVLGGSIVGVLYWKDRFTKTQWLGIFLTFISVLLLF